MTFEIEMHADAREVLLELDLAIKARILKRMERMRHELRSRHMMHGIDFFIAEAGQYRIAYKISGNTKIVFFIGKHKDYEDWYEKRRK